jgi:hypothetical protein
VFCGGRSSLLSKRELYENEKKFFWLLWKHFRRKGMKGVSRRKKRRRKDDLIKSDEIFNFENNFLLETHEGKGIIILISELTDSQAAKIANFGEICQRKIQQGFRSLDPGFEKKSNIQYFR